MGKRGGAKRKASHIEMEEATRLNKPSKQDTARPLPKRRRLKEKPCYSDQPRNLEDLWKAAFPVCTSWYHVDSVYNEFKWDFSHLEQAFQEGGKLHHHEINANNDNNNKFYLFGTTEIHKQDVGEYVLIPVVVAIVSASPPCHQLGFDVTDYDMPGANERVIIPMKKLKMDWIPYIPVHKRQAKVERLMKRSPQIFVLGCTQRKVALEHINSDRCLKIQYSVPCLHDHHDGNEVDKTNTRPLSPLREFLLEQVIQEDEFLPQERKDFLMGYVREQLFEAKRAANKKPRIYKFYPLPTPHTPPLRHKFAGINNFCPDADEVL
ncbi:unnamed protein product [Prunus armeniaca]|uniref:Uncharacterized protein n=1 Tax=Prunus armeniaca TaxID=36596 RepID=A0A6J5XXD5_PRUAR|nr:unnamed protein product [Prunus armeniaca]